MVVLESPEGYLGKEGDVVFDRVVKDGLDVVKEHVS